MAEFTSFGDPDLFEIAVRWRDDAEPRVKRPREYGWSTGDMRIRVGGRLITEVERGAVRQSFVSWYLLPVFDWLAEHWTQLLHEESFTWPERSASPAAIACTRRMRELIRARDHAGREQYAQAQAWWRRHALREAANGGLLPDLFLRRYRDQVEVSWTSGAPLFAPEAFRFTAEPNAAYLAVADVATPLWDALNWAAASSNRVASGSDDERALTELKRRVGAVRDLTVIDFAAFAVPAVVLKAAVERLTALGATDLLQGQLVDGAPAVAAFGPAVAMFGGVSPQIGVEDVHRLTDVLVQRRQAPEGSLLSSLVADAGAPLTMPHLQGQQLAAGLLDSLAPAAVGWIDVREICLQLAIEVRELQLETDSVRGVAFAGPGIGPTIIVNETSAFNRDENGRRFAIAHELCHILYDRTFARRLGITSGAWAPAGVERRANAFAALLLMPRELVLNAVDPGSSLADHETLVSAAGRLRVGVSALVEHASNLGLITDDEREVLRVEWRSRRLH